MGQDGVFKDLVNERAFADRTILSLWGTKRKQFLPVIQVIRNKPIGGTRRFYSRCVEAVHAATGNPVELRYGRLKPYSTLPPYRLDLRTHHVPLTGSQVAHVANGFLRKGFRGYVAQIELTMDVRNFTPDDFYRLLFTKARRIRKKRGYGGRKTIYIGGPHSRWQIRIYQKTSLITRVELVRRRPYLQFSSIVHAYDPLVLRNFDLSKVASWKEFDRHRLKKAVASVQPRWKRELFLDWPRYLPVQMLAAILKEGRQVQSLLISTKAELLLKKMVLRFLW